MVDFCRDGLLRLYVVFSGSGATPLVIFSILDPKAVDVQLTTDLIDCNTSPLYQAEYIPNAQNTQGKICAGVANVIVERNPGRCQ